jgi:predicted acylesterase/phospholipase RssA
MAAKQEETMAQSQESEGVKLGKEILAGKQVSPGELLDLVKKKLKKERAFGLARKLLDKYASDPHIRSDPNVRVRIAQERALCTYKDPDLPTDERLDQALQILREDADLDKTTDRETLGLAGAIYKRKWELTAQERDLEQSFAYYNDGYMNGTTEDYGYTGINTAFVLDLLADHESELAAGTRQGVDSADLRRTRSKEIRREIAARLPPLLGDPKNEWLKGEWWLWTTLGEAHFGLDEFQQARKYLLEAKALRNIPGWEKETTARQLATLVLMKRKTSPAVAKAAEECLREFLDNDYAVTSVIRGKMGLALSGGGFRASLYHVGVLAKLAELDLLRSIEYLSCVSGGSIIGAYYYLEVRNLLRSKRDDEITREDYIQLVQRIEKEFLAGVQRNIRTRILAEWLNSVRIIFLPEYSRTKRAGELYESELYSRIKDEENQSARWLNELTVIPKDEKEKQFKPKDDNWRRSNKVPILILNATTLNTGHNWQFTATWMGEPPGTIDTQIDANYRLRRMYYNDAPKGNRKVRLGDAVAASACVPGIFEPLAITHLYEREVPKDERGVNSKLVIEPILRLVDGGVHDNQGVAALLDQGCNVLLVSDASGQMNAEDFPSNRILGVPLRSNNILQARVREAQYQGLCSRLRSGLLKGLIFVHLKQELLVNSIDWIDCPDPSERKTPSLLTRYGVRRDIQRRLAAIRTDLDSFSDAEAYSLMCSGYLMIEHILNNDRPLGFAVPRAARSSWQFLQVEELMKQTGAGNALLDQLKVGNRLFLKPWGLIPWMKWIGGVVVLALLALLGWLMSTFWTSSLVSLSVGGAIVLVSGIVVFLVGFGLISKIVNYRKTLDQILIGFGLASLGWLLARLHLHVFDRLFLRQGSLDRLVRQSSK